MARADRSEHGDGVLIFSREDLSFIQPDTMFGRKLSFVLFAFLELLLCVSILGPLLVILDRCLQHRGASLRMHALVQSILYNQYFDHYS